MRYCRLLTRVTRAKAAEATILALLDDQQREFITFVLNKYIEIGVDELDPDQLPMLLKSKYDSLEDAKKILGEIFNIRQIFSTFQTYLYEQKVA